MLKILGSLDADLKRYSKADTIKAAFIIGASIFRSESTQVNL